MTKRSRWIAGLAFGLLGAALAVGALNSRSERPDVQILVTGYTSWPALSEGCAQDIHASSGLQKKATLLVTNCGRAPVRVLPFCDARVRSNKVADLRSYLRLKSPVLNPGESTRVEWLVPHGREGEIHRAELAYYRLDLVHRLSQRARSSTNIVARNLAKLVPRSPQPRWVRSEPITNSVTYLSRELLTAMQQAPSDDALAPPKFE